MLKALGRSPVLSGSAGGVKNLLTILLDFLSLKHPHFSQAMLTSF
jgi:hypothetical protein